MGKVKWTENASKNLKHICGYIAKDSEIYATRFVKSLIGATVKFISYVNRVKSRVFFSTIPIPSFSGLSSPPNLFRGSLNFQIYFGLFFSF